MFEEVAEDLVGQCRGGGGDFAVHQHEVKKDVVDVRFGVGGAGNGGYPAWTGNAVIDEFAELFDCRFDVGLEEAGIDLAEGVADGLAFVCEFD